MDVSTSGHHGAQVKLVLQRNQLFVESPDKQVLQKLLRDADIKAAHEAAGGGGIVQGRGRSDTAAQAMASHLQNIDLTEAVPDEDQDGDEEAAEAEREMRAAVAGSTGATPSASGRPSAAGSAAGRPPAGRSGAAGAGEDPGKKARCESKPIPFAENSAIAAVSEHDVDIFSFEISALHVRYPRRCCMPIRTLVLLVECVIRSVARRLQLWCVRLSTSHGTRAGDSHPV